MLDKLQFGLQYMVGTNGGPNLRFGKGLRRSFILDTVDPSYTIYRDDLDNTEQAVKPITENTINHVRQMGPHDPIKKGSIRHSRTL